MTEVFIDGEQVNFEGALPATVGQLVQLVENALAGSGRVIAAITVDGTPLEDADGTRPFSEAARVDVSSLSAVEAVARLAADLVRNAGEVRERAGILAGDVLRRPWSDVQAACVAQAESIGALLQDASTVAEHRGGSDGAVGSALSSLMPALERWMDAIAAADAAGVSLGLDGDLNHALDGLVRSLGADVEGATV